MGFGDFWGLGGYFWGFRGNLALGGYFGGYFVVATRNLLLKSLAFGVSRRGGLFRGILCVPLAIFCLRGWQLGFGDFWGLGGIFGVFGEIGFWRGYIGGYFVCSHSQSFA